MVLTRQEQKEEGRKTNSCPRTLYGYLLEPALNVIINNGVLKITL